MSHPAILTSGLAGSVGLCFDIIGAFFLARSFVFKRPAEAIVETRSFMDGSPYPLRSITQQSVEARAGFLFLFLGFTGQFVTYTTWLTIGPDRRPLWIVGGAAVVFLMAHQVVLRRGRSRSRQRVAKEWGEAAVKNLKDAISTNDDSRIERDAWFYGGAMDVPEKKNETAKELAERTIKMYETHGGLSSQDSGSGQRKEG